jgi:hypothetical protein
VTARNTTHHDGRGGYDVRLDGRSIGSTRRSGKRRWIVDDDHTRGWKTRIGAIAFLIQRAGHTPASHRSKPA